jgi:hypothetical protein
MKHKTENRKMKKISEQNKERKGNRWADPRIGPAQQPPN